MGVQVGQEEAPRQAVEAPQRSRRKLRLFRLLAFVVVPGAFVTLLAVGLFTTTRPRAVVGTTAPEFALPLLGADQTFSSTELKGAPVVVNFWASWCLPCREEAPALERAWRQYRDRGVRFVGVNIQDTEKDALAFVKEFDITYPSVRDVEGALSRDFGVRGVPETFFIDHRWRFFGIGAQEQVGARGGTKILGAISPRLLRSEIDQLLARIAKEG